MARRIALILIVLLAVPALGLRAQDAKPQDAKTQAAGAKDAKAKESELLLEDLFPRKGHFGKGARNMAWSYDDRYLAYLWNPYGEKGWDLWLYDSKDHKTRRLTSIEMFTAFDREVQPIIDRYKKDKEEDEKRKKLTDEERRKLDREEEQKDRDRKEPLKEYAGISEFKWANKSNEMLFAYRGDIYRLVIGQDTPTRIHKTDEGEAGLKYARDDKAFYFQRGSNLFRARFDGPTVEQLNPKLPAGVTMGDYWLSPDETRMLYSAWKTTAPSRQVTYLTYKDRFATAATTGRDVADDPFKGESYLYVVDLNDDPKKGDGKPWEVYKWPAGDDMGQVSVNEKPWTADSKRVCFSTWKRDERELSVVIAEPEGKKLTTVYRDIHNGEHTTPGMVDPMFTPDGSKIVVLLEKSGYRHAWLIDPLAAGATQVTRGDFNVYPVKLTEDGKTLFVTSDKQHPARMDVYRVSLPDGQMERLTDKDGRYGAPAISHDFKTMAATCGSWKSLTELYVMNAREKGGERAITASHPDTWARVNKISPELFSYKNRNGQMVYGYLFLPPGFKKADKRPLLIYVYGGPLGTGKTVEDGSFGGDGYTFPMYVSYKLGYVCASIDPRGASGYSAAFGNANWEQPGKAQVEDLVDGVKWLTDTYGIDTRKVGIHGWSFGGFQTQMCMYTAPETFTLGIAGAGPTEWQNYNNWYAGGVIGKARKPEDLDKYSLTHLAKNLKSPLMLLHGMEDTNVLFQDTIKVYRELLRAGKGPLVELVLDPTGGHGLGGDIKYRDRFAIYEGFLMKHWGPYRAEK